MKSSFRPRRSSALVRPLRDEIIVDQKESFHVHALNSTAVEAWKLADGTQSPRSPTSTRPIFCALIFWGREGVSQKNLLGEAKK
jgi:hypothetical protein